MIFFRILYFAFLMLSALGFPRPPQTAPAWQMSIFFKASVLVTIIGIINFFKSIWMMRSVLVCHRHHQHHLDLLDQYKHQVSSQRQHLKKRITSLRLLYLISVVSAPYCVTTPGTFDMGHTCHGVVEQFYTQKQTHWW